MIKTDAAKGENMEQSGAASNQGVVECLSNQLSSNIPDLLFGGNPFGCIYLTYLYNFAPPLIRYRISDSLVLKAAGKRRPVPPDWGGCV